MSLTSYLARKLIGNRLLGSLDYWRKPQLRDAWGGPFNGQAARQDLYRLLIKQLPVACVVETGTFRGDTTKFMHSVSGLPVFTVESGERNYGYARARLKKTSDIHLTLGDSRDFLRKLADCRRGADQGIFFFYLDAHWQDDLPLLEEVEIVAQRWPKSVVMIDDFKVPDDPGYGYDDYGPGKVLEIEYLRAAVHLAYTAFFPARRSDCDSGARRGCVVLAFDSDTVAALNAVPLLRRA
jgi:hypothetical protein